MIYTKDSFEVYHGSPQINASDLKNFLISPRYFYYEKYEKKKEQSEEAKRTLILGSYIHELILEPQEVEKNYYVIPKFDLRTKAGKESFEGATFERSGRFIYEHEHKHAIGIAEAAKANKTLQLLIEDSHAELSIYSVDEETGIEVKVRPDGFPNKKDTVLDLKTCESSDYESFRRQVYTYEYDLSAAFYLYVTKRSHYIFAALEKSVPYQIGIYELAEKHLSRGFEKMRMALDLLAYCRAENVWPDYSEFRIMKALYQNNMLGSYKDEIARFNGITIIE